MNNEQTRPTWALETSNLPAVVCSQPQGPMISFIFKSSWGSSIVEIQGAKVQDQDGKIMSGEAYELKFSIVVKRCMSPVIKMEYCKYLKSLVAITSNGNIFIEPLIYIS